MHLGRHMVPATTGLTTTEGSTNAITQSVRAHQDKRVLCCAYFIYNITLVLRHPQNAADHTGSGVAAHMMLNCIS